MKCHGINNEETLSKLKEKAKMYYEKDLTFNEVYIQGYSDAMNEVRKAVFLAKCDERESKGYDHLNDSDIMDIIEECERLGIEITRKYIDEILEDNDDEDDDEDEDEDEDWLYETGESESEIMGSGVHYYNVFKTKDKDEAMRMSKQDGRDYLIRSKTVDGKKIEQTYSVREGWF